MGWVPIDKLPRWIWDKYSRDIRAIPPGGYIVIKGKRFLYKVTDHGTHYKKYRPRRGRRSGKRGRHSPSTPATGILLLCLGLAVVLAYVMFPAGVSLPADVSPEREISSSDSPSEHNGGEQEHTVDDADTHELERGAGQKNTYPFVLWGNVGSIDIDVYEGINEYLSSNRPRYHGDDREYYLEYINDDVQSEYLLDLVDRIKAESSDADAQARIAISLVQHIPYDYGGMFRTVGSIRHPYEVLYDGEGVCSEKSLLAAFLLKELGYGVALLEFTGEKHMVLGVKAPAEYTYKDTGYAFVETTTPSIITDSDADYFVVGKLASNPVVFPVSDGRPLRSLEGDYQDAREYRGILAKGPVLDRQDYLRWQILTEKYGI